MSRLKMLVVGVGGQGALTAARFLGDAALVAGEEVNVGQLHGMSQRGGSVECSVLLGPGSGSTIPNGGADLVLALEPLEALRARPKMSKETRVVLNLGRIVPFSMASAGRTYPPIERVISDVRAVAPAVYEVDGPTLVAQTGVPRTLNIVMLGALAGLDMLPFPTDVLWRTIEKRIPERFLEANRKAFELGTRAVAS
jgi:indolepyruvate ferredoxin oxidoreductase beta subunit